MQGAQSHPLTHIVSAQKRGEAAGIYSCCSAHPLVLKAALLMGKRFHTPVLIEATANQVDQYGGYTGMKPADFYRFVGGLVKETGIDPALVMLGGDHLGPLTFSKLPEREAMAEASELIRQYVLAGFTKIHLDTSMRLADDDKTIKLSDATIAKRGAALCRVAEEAFQERRAAGADALAPVYIIGSEVPTPGGVQEAEESIAITSPEACRQTIEAFHAAFVAEGLTDTWRRVLGLVVQPGVEFGDIQVIPYCREQAKALTAVIKEYPGMVLEGHSTDYQTKHALKEMVEDGVAILKVGPALTFALREGLLALEAMEKELCSGSGLFLSDFRNILESVMLDEPRYWQGHYHGKGTEQRFARIFSYSDRARYYLANPLVQASISRLLSNLRAMPIPPTLLSQYMPLAYEAMKEGSPFLGAETLAPEALLYGHIGDCIEDYLYATGVID